MLDYHTTRSGEKILICRMSDQHLQNAIRYFARQIAANRNLPVGERSASLPECHNSLSSLALEALLRGLPVRDALIGAYVRCSAISSDAEAQSLLDLFEPADEYDDYETDAFSIY